MVWPILKYSFLFLDEKCSIFFLLENAKMELPLFPPSVLVQDDRVIWLEITKGLFFWVNIWWWIHYFIWGWTGKFCCYTECFGLPIVCLNSVMFIKTDLEQGFLSFSWTECQVCPCQIIQKMNLSYIFILISLMLHWWKWVLSQHSFKKLIEIPNYCLFPNIVYSNTRFGNIHFLSQMEFLMRRC